MSGNASSALDALQKSSITQLSKDELNKILDEIVQKNSDKIKEDGMKALSFLMGKAMNEVRGKTSGSLVNELLSKKIKYIIK